MNNTKNIAKNIGVTGISQIIISILGFILLIYVARFLGEAQYGNYSFAISFTLLFTIFADLGISQLIIRDIARNKEVTSQYLTNASIIKILLSFVTFGLIALIINLMNYPSEIIYVVYLFAIFMILSSFAQMFMSIFQAFEKLEYSAIILMVQQIIIISLGLLILYLGYGLIELAYVYVLAGVVDVIFGFILVIRKITKPKQKIDFSIWKTLTWDSLSFGINGFFGILFFKLDTVLLSIFKDNIAVGIYNAAYNPLLALTSAISTIVISTLYPVMSKNFISSKESLETFTILSVRYMAIIGFPLGIGSFVLANRLIGLFYAGQYFDSIIAFQILALFIPIRLISSVTGTLLTSINKQGIRTFSVFLAAIFNILLNIALIPSLSYVGSSIATVLSEMFLYFILTYFIDKYYTKLKLHKHFIRPLIASLIMGVILFYSKEINLFLVIIFAILVYFSVLILLKTFTKDDIYIFKQIIKRN